MKSARDAYLKMRGPRLHRKASRSSDYDGMLEAARAFNRAMDTIRTDGQGVFKLVSGAAKYPGEGTQVQEVIDLADSLLEALDEATQAMQRLRDEAFDVGTSGSGSIGGQDPEDV